MGAPHSPTSAPASPLVDVSIVVVVYRTPHYLEQCLESLFAAAPAVSFDLHVLDNAPLDDASERVARVFAERHRAHSITYVRNERNLGFAKAVNQGIDRSRGRHVLVLNPDVEVPSGAIETLVQYLDAHADVGLTAPRLHYPSGELQLSCRTFYTLPIFLLRRTFLGKVFPNARAIREHLMLDWDHESTREVDWCLGGALLVRRKAIQDVGKMDERFFLYFEDVDWCYRMHQRGWKVVYHPASRMVHHYQRASAGWKPSRGLWLHLASTLRFYEKWSFLLYWLKLRSSVLRKVALFIVDLAMVVLAFVVAYGLRSAAADVLTKPLFGFALYNRFLVFTTVVAMGSFLSFGHYRERVPPRVLDNLFPVARALLWTAGLMMAATFLFSVRTYSRVIVVLFFPLAVVFVTAGRVGLARLVQKVKERDLALLRIGVLGPDDAVLELLDRFRRFGRFGMEPVPIAVPDPSHQDESGQNDVAAVRVADVLLQRLRDERVREVVLFEDCPGDVPTILAALRNAGMPVRLVPALRHALPTEGALTNFMGFPAVRLGGETVRSEANPGRRALDLVASIVLGVLLFLPFLLGATSRRLRRRSVIERLHLRGRSGRRFEVSRLANSGSSAGATLIAYYPALTRLAAGELSLVGIYPFSEAEWEALPSEYRSAPPSQRPGILGPWLWDRASLAARWDWNRTYGERWSAAEDFRIFWTCWTRRAHDAVGAEKERA